MKSPIFALCLCFSLSAVLSACSTTAIQPSAATKPIATNIKPKPSIASDSCVNPALNVGADDFRCVYPKTADSHTILWSKIRAGLTMPDLDTDLVQNRTEWYARQPDYFARMTKRSEKYLFHIVEEVEKRGMPMEIALLPFIESAFVAKATSSAKAAGLWQFIPSTGRDYDLTQNTFRDDRRDVQASTAAALDYLQTLHNRFGDWHLALAAYNWGQGNVSRAITRNQAAGLGTSYTELRMPRETKEYVPKLQAIENIIRNPQQYGISLPEIANHPYFQVINIARDIDVELVTELAQVPLEEFRQLNPSFMKPVILAEGSPQILLPWESADTFLKNLKNYKDGPLATWTAWQNPTAMRIHDVAQLFDIDPEDLQEANRIPPKRIIRAGSTLLVPRDESQTDNVSALIADNAQISLQSERKAVKQKRFIRYAKAKNGSQSTKKLSKKEAARTRSVSKANTKQKEKQTASKSDKATKTAKSTKATPSTKELKNNKPTTKQSAEKASNPIKKKETANQKPSTPSSKNKVKV